ncbi:hypothetical protein SK128_022841 [Halocaridina rubra]|uniref:Uncharacterized protein n=1 Tax=Halocaridina rubra TaxID=373956 RepID=A0AAN9AG24_HALRR
MHSQVHTEAHQITLALPSPYFEKMSLKSVLLLVILATFLPWSTSAEDNEDYDGYEHYLTMSQEDLDHAISALEVKLQVLKVLSSLSDEQRVAMFSDRQKRSLQQQLIIYDPQSNVSITPYCGANAEDKLEGEPEIVIWQLATDLNASAANFDMATATCLMGAAMAFDAAVQAGLIIMDGVQLIIATQIPTDSSVVTGSDSPVEDGSEGEFDNQEGYYRPAKMVVNVQQIVNENGCGECQ